MDQLEKRLEMLDQRLDNIDSIVTALVERVMKQPVTVDWTIIGDTKELNIHGSHLGPYCYPIAIQMLEKGLLPMDQIITHQMPLADFQKGIDLVTSAKSSIKVTLTP